jgi:hypothetical protein
VGKREEATQIVKQLLREGLKLDSLIVRILYSRFVQHLLAVLVERFSGSSRWKDFLDAIVTAPRPILRKRRLGRRFLEAFVTAEADRIRILRQHQARLTDQEHPFFKSFGRTFDETRAAAVRKHMLQGRYRRAWERLNEMRCGIFMQRSLVKHLRRPEHFQDASNRCYQAEPKFLRCLVFELYERMVRAGLLLRMTRQQLMAYDPAWRNKDLPGFVFADLLGLSTPEAKMVFDIAAHYSDIQNARRRATHRPAWRYSMPGGETRTIH